MTLAIFGIRNCNTMKAAFEWLESHHVPYRFHDYRKAGADRDALMRWCNRLGWPALVNTRGTTWRKLDASRQNLADEGAAIELMVEYPSLIRRPVVETESGELLVGFSETVFAERLLPPGEHE
ncbi:MAG TPA: ArsC family reductase [Rhodocyclaceae bacterium]|jgi:arsenate reductase (glutaredoxin)|nr:ArsC family reductase [Rhodocyclaceae bacterium]HRQ46790.1 ArsC family reductase [Rhodocyclaceae bacterium]